MFDKMKIAAVTIGVGLIPAQGRFEIDADQKREMPTVS